MDDYITAFMYALHAMKKRKIQIIFIPDNSKGVINSSCEVFANKHNVSFELAKAIFIDHFQIEDAIILNPTHHGESNHQTNPTS